MSEMKPITGYRLRYEHVHLSPDGEKWVPTTKWFPRPSLAEDHVKAKFRVGAIRNARLETVEERILEVKKYQDTKP